MFFKKYFRKIREQYINHCKQFLLRLFKDDGYYYIRYFNSNNDYQTLKNDFLILGLYRFIKNATYFTTDYLHAIDEIKYLKDFIFDKCWDYNIERNQIFDKCVVEIKNKADFDKFVKYAQNNGLDIEYNKKYCISFILLVYCDFLIIREKIPGSHFLIDIKEHLSVDEFIKKYNKFKERTLKEIVPLKICLRYIINKKKK